jgi:hypothetical protein
MDSSVASFRTPATITVKTHYSVGIHRYLLFHGTCSYLNGQILRSQERTASF